MMNTNDMLRGLSTGSAFVAAIMCLTYGAVLAQFIA